MKTTVFLRRVLCRVSAVVLSAALLLPVQAQAQAPAKKVFGAQSVPTHTMKSRAIGFYSKGCMAGGTDWMV